MKKRICMIYTGGTIGMTRGENGYVPDRETFYRSLNSVADLFRPEFPEFQVVAFDPLLDSCDIAVREWNQIGREIARRYQDFDGFVVLHGTDTMAYSASALSFMLENLDKPVVFTGSQIPLNEARSDGQSNLVNAAMIAASGQAREVSLYFHDKLFRGNRSTKKSSDRFDAFVSPNAPPLAQVGITIQYTGMGRPAVEGPFRLQELLEVPVGVIKLFPGIQFELFEAVMTQKLRGVVLETFGSGNIPSCGSTLLPIIEKAHRRGSIITVCSQCSQGTVSLGAYATSKALRDIGAVNGLDMTTEAAVTKLYYLFSKGLSNDEIKVQMVRDLRGELTPGE